MPGSTGTEPLPVPVVQAVEPSWDYEHLSDINLGLPSPSRITLLDVALLTYNANVVYVVAVPFRMAKFYKHS